MAMLDDPLLELIGDVHGLLGLEEFRYGLMGAVVRAVPADWVSINEVGPEPGDHWEIVEPELPVAAHETFGRLMHQNPLVARMRTGPRPGAPLRLSDVATAREFRKLEIYRELYGPLGIEHQIAFTLPEAPPRILGVVLSRRRRDFTDAERDLLARARPFLIQSYRNALAFEALRGVAGREQMIAALREAGLTGREAEALAIVARGASSADAANAMGVGVRTVDKHLQNALAKLGAKGRSRGAALAWKLTDEWGRSAVGSTISSDRPPNMHRRCR